MMTSAYRLHDATIWNFRAIGEVTVQFPEQVHVVIGENGAGKTSFLQALQMGLGSSVRDEAGGDGCYMTESVEVPPGPNRVEGSTPARHAGVRLRGTWGTSWWGTSRAKAADWFEDAATRALRDSIPPHDLSPSDLDIQGTWRRGDWWEFKRDWAMDYAQVLTVQAYYGVHRLSWDDGRVSDVQFDPLARAWIGIGTQGHVLPLERLAMWFYAAENIELREARERGDLGWRLPVLEAVRQAIEGLIPKVRRPRVDAGSRQWIVDVHDGGGVTTVPVSHLAGGIRSMVSLVADLAQRMVQANPALGLASPAIVLIDEIDLHLHPSWQLEIIPSLRRTFPNAQFIVTTHSALVTGSVPQESLIRLTPGPHGVVLAPPVQVQGALPERILEEAMGLDGVRSKEIAGALHRYWKLIESGHGEEDEAKRIRETLNRIWPDGDPELLRADLELRRRRLGVRKSA